MVFQTCATFPHLNVADTIGFGLRKLRRDRAERARRIDAMRDRIKLPGFGDRARTEAESLGAPFGREVATWLGPMDFGIDLDRLSRADRAAFAA